MTNDSPRRTLIIGGNSGIGKALAIRLQSKGHQVSAAARDTAPLEELGIASSHFEAMDAESLPEIPESLDGLIYCPGTINLKPFLRLSPTEFEEDLQVNLLGAVRVLQAAFPALKKSARASVVLFSTVAVQTGMPFHAGVAAAKGAIEGLTRSLAAEWTPTIRVNAIAPSLTDTKLAANFLRDEKRREAAASRHPLKAVGTAEDVAALAEFLLSSESRMMTGQILCLDGGLSSVRLF